MKFTIVFGLETIFTTRVMRHDFVVKSASLRSEIRPYMRGNFEHLQKDEIHHFCGPKFAAFYYCKTPHLWMLFRPAASSGATRIT